MKQGPKDTSVGCDWWISIKFFFLGSLVVVVIAENFTLLFRGHVLLTCAVNHQIACSFVSVSFHCVTKENPFLSIFGGKGFEKFKGPHSPKMFHLERINGVILAIVVSKSFCHSISPFNCIVNHEGYIFLKQLYSLAELFDFEIKLTPS